ncbi:MAG TPA: cytochrome P450 [Actinophytocola sp.]|jgi:cytochrome P450|uniref:cytochrome P450 n=1 Tax=Actinophytocola sp. TaxID=1872138 RepID=UPI002E06E9A7|nr:cytochrome P450 [Actinophytocola sp.]
MDERATGDPAVLAPFPYPFNGNEGIDVSETYDLVRDLARLPKVQLLNGEPAWLVTRYEDARFVLGDPRFSRAAGAGRAMPSQADLAPNGASLIGLDPPEHTRVRGLVAKPFSVHEVERLRPWVRAMVESLVDRMERLGPPADLVEDFAAPISLGVIAGMIGVPDGYRAQIREWSDARMSAAGRPAEEILAKSEQLRTSVLKLVEARRAEPAGDLLTTLVAARDSGELTEQELVDLCMALMVAGYEGPVNQIAKFAYFLVERPELWDELRAEPSRLPEAIDEMLRFIPLFRGAGTMPRYPTTDVEIGGTLVREGEPVLVAIGGSNRDERQFAAAGEFRLDRGASHLAWGHGVHNCIGRPIGTIELQEALAGLLARFPRLHLAGEVTWKKQVIRGAHHLPVTWQG